MIDITDRNHKPDINEISTLIGNSLFDDLYNYMNTTFQALCSIEYSGDKVLLGWNVKFHKSGRTLIRLYPKKNYFTVLVVVGRKEKERVESLLPKMSKSMQQIYNNTQEGMGQRWLLMDLYEADALYNDVLTLIRIRRESK